MNMGRGHLIRVLGDRSGMGLVEVMVAGAVMMTLSLAMAMMFKSLNDQLSHAKALAAKSSVGAMVASNIRSEKAFQVTSPQNAVVINSYENGKFFDCSDPNHGPTSCFPGRDYPMHFFE